MDAHLTRPDGVRIALDTSGDGTAMAAAPVPAPLADVPGYPPRALGVAPDLLPSVLRGAARSDLPPREQLARLPQPVLILAWADEPGHPVSTAQELARTLPHARLHVSEDAADSRSWGKRVADFLDEG
jgi:3-oxoadipate enol-lactonase